MKIQAIAIGSVGLLGQLLALYFFVLRPESAQLLPFIAAASLFSALEGVGVLLFIRSR